MPLKCLHLIPALTDYDATLKGRKKVERGGLQFSRMSGVVLGGAIGVNSAQRC